MSHLHKALLKEFGEGEDDERDEGRREGAGWRNSSGPLLTEG